jgi:hypothetical protein
LRVRYGKVISFPTKKDTTSEHSFRKFILNELSKSRRSGQVTIELVTGDPTANHTHASSTTIGKDGIMSAEGRDILIEQMYDQYRRWLEITNSALAPTPGISTLSRLS